MNEKKVRKRNVCKLDKLNWKHVFTGSLLVQGYQKFKITFFQIIQWISNLLFHKKTKHISNTIWSFQYSKASTWRKLITNQFIVMVVLSCWLSIHKKPKFVLKYCFWKFFSQWTKQKNITFLKEIKIRFYDEIWQDPANNHGVYSNCERKRNHLSKKSPDFLGSALQKEEK